MSPEAAQQKVEEVQLAYRSWLDLYPQLENSLMTLTESVALMDTMKNFYFGGTYLELSKLLAENQLTLDLATQGEHSVMGEDVIWNAVHDHRALLWKFLRSTVRALDEEQDEPEQLA